MTEKVNYKLIKKAVNYDVVKYSHYSSRDVRTKLKPNTTENRGSETTVKTQYVYNVYSPIINVVY